MSMYTDPAAALRAPAKSSGAPPLPEKSRTAGLRQNTEEALLSYFRFFLYLKGSSGCGTSYATPCVGKWEHKLILKVQRRLSSALLEVGWWVEKAAVGTRPSAVLAKTLSKSKTAPSAAEGRTPPSSPPPCFFRSASSHRFLNHSCP